MMTLEPWQERLLEELQQLNERIVKLKNMLDNGSMPLDVADIILLERQLYYMRGYRIILNQRIQRFQNSVYKRG